MKAEGHSPPSILLLAAAALAGLGLLVAGCSDGDPPASTLTPTLEPAPTTASEARQTPPPAAVSDEPTLIFFDGDILTMDDSQPRAQAIALRGETIIAVGSDADVTPLAGTSTTLVDLDGRVLIPGFIDPHNHAIFEPLRGQADPFPGWEDVTYEEVQDRLLAVGITTVGNPGGTPGALNNIIPYVEANGLRMRVNLYLLHNGPCGEPLTAGWYRSYRYVTEPSEMLRILGVKFFTDGGSCNTPATTQADGSPGGDLYFDAETLATEIIRVQEEGHQVAIHAVGDRGVDVALDALAIALDGQPNTYRHRIEHNLVVRPDQVARYGEIGAIPVLFGDTRTCLINSNSWHDLLGEPHGEPLEQWAPWRQILDQNPGLIVTWHSDAPRSGPLEPLSNLWTLVTQKTQDVNGNVCEPPPWMAANAVTVEEALRMMTINAAYTLQLDEVVGSLEPGKYADIVMLSHSPLTVEPDEIPSIGVLMTMVNGRVEYCEENHDFICPD